MSDESLGDHDALFPGPDEALPADERFVSRMRPGDRHVIRWIAVTNFPQPCQRGSAVGISYFFSYAFTVASTSPLLLFSLFISIPATFPPPIVRVENLSHSISSLTVGIGP